MLLHTIFTQLSSRRIRPLAFCLSGAVLLAGLSGCKSSQTAASGSNARSADRAPARLATKPSYDDDRDDDDDEPEEYPDFRGRRSAITVPEVELLPAPTPVPGANDRTVAANRGPSPRNSAPAAVAGASSGAVVTANADSDESSSADLNSADLSSADDAPAPKKASKLRSLFAGSAKRGPVPVSNPPRLGSTPFSLVSPNPGSDLVE